MGGTRSAGSGRSRAGSRSTGREPTPRALEAMALAASRSRDRAGPPTAGRRPIRSRRPHGATRERRLRISVVASGAAVLVAGVALAVAHAAGPNENVAHPPGTTMPSSQPASGSGGVAPTSTTTTATTAVATTDAPPATTTTGPPPATAAGGGVPTPPAGSDTTSTTASPAPSAGGPPAIISLTPVTGGPGTPVTVTGSGFLSADGSIVAHVDGQVAPTSCPDQTTCTVTVPSLPGGPGTVPVTVTTDAGTSAPASFSYG